MCGIFGYIGSKKNAAQTVLSGLKLLEYRGYDSWGIAIKPQNLKLKTQNEKLIIDKHIGKIGKAVIGNKLSVISHLAIGHTRWATHGGVTDKNAHPHLDCKKEIAVVHNGIIENFEDLKKDLKNKGHKFASETDSEIIPHLIEEEMKTTKNIEKAVKNTFNKLKGMNALVVSSIKSNEIIAAKTGSPLVVGKGEEDFYLASDASGILPHTKNLLFMSDNQMVILGKKPKLLNLLDGKTEKMTFEKATWETKFEEKGDFPHFMIKEIGQQSTIIRSIAKNIDSQLEKLTAAIENAHGTFFIGAGTAYHAGLVGTYLFSKISKRHVNMAVASEFNYLLDFINKESLIIALSQSGETIDVIEPLSIAQKKGSTIASLVNSPGSTIFRMSDIKLLLNAGVEQAVASTKAYTAKVSKLLIISYMIYKREDEASKQLLLAAEEIDRIIKEKEKLKPVADFLSKSENVYIIGRGVSFATSLEAALKIKEVTYIHAEGLAGGELKHGTLALISKGTPCIVFAPQDETYQAILSNAIEIKSRGGVIIGVGPKKEDVFDYFIQVKDCLDANPIAQIVPAQILAYLIAVKRGLDPDKPRNLAKSVTVK